MPGPTFEGVKLSIALFLFWSLPAVLTPTGTAVAQPARPVARYWVTLTDKNGVDFNPNSYFSAAARTRRARQHLPAFTGSDLPLRADYLAAVRAGVDTVTLESRWFNAVACRATAGQAAALRRLPGVREVAAWPLNPGIAAASVSPRPHLSPNAQPPIPRQSTHPTNLHQIVPNDYLLARRQTAHLDGPAPAPRRAGWAGADHRRFRCWL